MANIRPDLAALVYTHAGVRHITERSSLMNSSHALEMNHDHTEIETVEVTSALNAILNTDKFSASPQMSAFLKYVVEQTQLGNTRRIKAFTVGLEALGKPASFDPQTDPSVRVLAKRLRHSLEAYYEQNPHTTIIIDMKPGSYVPKFLLRDQYVSQPDTRVTTVSTTTPATIVGNTQSSSLPLAHTTTSHVSVNQPMHGSLDAINSAAEQRKPDDGNAEESKAREANIQNLWNAYRTA